MGHMFTGDVYSKMDVNDENLKEKRYEATVAMQRALMQRFAKGAEDQSAAAIMWVNTYPESFRAIVDNETSLVTRYLEGGEEEKDAVLSEIEKRLAQ